MDSRLFMEIGFDNSTFQAIDKTPYERWINDGYLDNEHEHMILQRFSQIKDLNESISDVFTVISNDISEFRNPFEKENITNGLYYYQKMLIPSWEHTTTANEHLFFDSNGLIHFVDIDSGIDNTYNPEKDFDEIYNILRSKYPDNCFYFDDYAFTIYDLIECYILTERERINNYLNNNCRKVCKNPIDNLDDRADFLLAAITVIKALIEKSDFFEALRLVNGLNTCGNLCKKYNKSLKGCGCDGT